MVYVDIPVTFAFFLYFAIAVVVDPSLPCLASLSLCLACLRVVRWLCVYYFRAEHFYRVLSPALTCLPLARYVIPS